MKQINLLVTFVAVDFKRKNRQGKPKFLEVSKGQKSETAMTHKNKTKKYPVDITCQNVSWSLLWLTSWLEEDIILTGPKWHFLSYFTFSHPQKNKAPPKKKKKKESTSAGVPFLVITLFIKNRLQHRCFPVNVTKKKKKHHRRTKIYKTILSGCCSSVSHTEFTYQNCKANKYSILTVRISKFYANTDSKHSFYKTEIENCLPIGFNLGSNWEPEFITIQALMWRILYTQT